MAHLHSCPTSRPLGPHLQQRLRWVLLACSQRRRACSCMHAASSAGAMWVCPAPILALVTTSTGRRAAHTASQRNVQTRSSGLFAALLQSMHKFNPFQLGGSGGSGDPTSTLAAFSSTSTGQGSGQRIPLTAAAHLLQAGASRPGSGSSNASPHAGLLAARLEALQREPPAWLIDPNQLMLELTGDGRLLLLGVGHYGACYRGWLLPQPAGAKAAAAGAGAGAAPPALAKQVAPGGALATTIGSSEVRVAIKVLNIADMDAAFFKVGRRDCSVLPASVRVRAWAVAHLACCYTVPSCVMLCAVCWRLAPAERHIRCCIARAMLCHAVPRYAAHAASPRPPAVPCCAQEADILHRLGGSPHVVALHGACVVDQHMVVVMELMQVGS